MLPFRIHKSLALYLLALELISKCAAFPPLVPSRDQESCADTCGGAMPINGGIHSSYVYSQNVPITTRPCSCTFILQLPKPSITPSVSTNEMEPLVLTGNNFIPRVKCIVNAGLELGVV
ncbi:hypothetical protein Pelo_16551 [Pelomyxa schiedti]|nr:hypothetical protein Pelo_16551 [Pelomyxa schiedti]